MTDVDPATFRQLCGYFATGVVVVTSATREGEPAGMTANSFTSVSLTPPLVSVNIELAADFHPVVTRSEGFAINVLGADQEALSRRFAGPARHRFEGVGYRLTPRGRIVLEGAVAVIECDRFAELAAGDHTIVVGRVVGGAVTGGLPLVYFRGGYHTLV